MSNHTELQQLLDRLHQPQNIEFLSPDFQALMPYITEEIISTENGFSEDDKDRLVILFTFLLSGKTANEFAREIGQFPVVFYQYFNVLLSRVINVVNTQLEKMNNAGSRPNRFSYYKMSLFHVLAAQPSPVNLQKKRGRPPKVAGQLTPQKPEDDQLKIDSTTGEPTPKTTRKVRKNLDQVEVVNLTTFFATLKSGEDFVKTQSALDSLDHDQIRELKKLEDGPIMFLSYVQIAAEKIIAITPRSASDLFLVLKKYGVPCRFIPAADGEVRNTGFYFIARKDLDTAIDAIRQEESRELDKLLSLEKISRSRRRW